MLSQVIEKLIKKNVEVNHLNIVFSGNHCSIEVVSPSFENLSRIQRHQKIYSCINEKIISGEIHAVNITPFSPEEWKKNKLQC
tara:strand:- start:904 stop:1152 length:249 start_codon:yes stop_codon:yes gene_type:complete